MIFMARWKVILNLIVCVLGILFVLPNVLSTAQVAQLPTWFQHKINLGLELRGGSHLQFEVDLKTVKKDMLTTLVDDIRAILRKEQIGYVGLALNQQKSGITFKLRDAGQSDKVSKILNALDRNLQITAGTAGEINIQYTEAHLEERLRAIIGQSIEVIRRRVDESGTKEPNILRQGNDRIIVQLPGIDDPAEVKKLIGKTAKMSFRLVDSNRVDSPNSQAAIGSEILSETRSDGRTSYLSIKKQVMVSGDTLTDAQVTTDQNGQPAVSLRFNAVGARKFADMSANHLKKQFAIILDNTVISAPVFQEPIPSGQGQISGHFSYQEATDLALLLRAGALPAPLKIIEERTVGPSLGADSIHDGQIATTLAIVLVGIFMILNYSLFGIFADIALVFNIIFLFAALGVLQATLTLPGIAGIALTVGMAVDSNVLIYERIKEELRHGAKIFSAIEAGG
ncbi:MAG: protein translocase subunit SecD [Alphaproteobacteria bacterium]